MAVRASMTVEEVVRRVLREEHADVIRESVRAVAREIMEAEVAESLAASADRMTAPRIATGIGRGAGTRAPGDRAADPHASPGFPRSE